MRSIAIILIWVGVVLAGEDSPYEMTLKQMLKSMEEITMQLKAIDSEAAAMAARPALRKSADTWIEARAKGAKLAPPERDEKVRLVKLYKPKLEQAMKKLFIETIRIEVIPGGKDALKEIQGVLKKEGKE
jgi:hypothetical protein